jgi:hypothetical protein
MYIYIYVLYIFYILYIYTYIHVYMCAYHAMQFSQDNIYIYTYQVINGHQRHIEF